MTKLAVVVCAAAAIGSASAAIERARLGIKGGQFDLHGFDGTGRDIFGFDTKGIDKWGRPITDGGAGLVAPVGKANPTTTTTAHQSTNPPVTTTNPPRPDKKTKTIVTPHVTPSFTPIPITYVSDATTITSMYVPSTAIYTVPPTFMPEPTPSAAAQCQSVYVFRTTPCIPEEIMKPMGPNIATIGDFLACDGFRTAIAGRKWQYLSYGCNAKVNNGVVTVLVCDAPESYKEIDITL